MVKNKKPTPRPIIHDLVTIGEPLLRLAPPRFEQLRRASTLDMSLAGAQMNVTANLARLGWKTALLTKLPDNALGHWALDALRSFGVDVAHLRLVPGGKMGLTFVEHSAAPRVPLSVFDRRGSAAGTIEETDFDLETILGGARMAYTDGIFSGLGAGCSRTVVRFLETARRHGVTTCFDLNYRQHLWTPLRALRVWQTLLDKVDILVTNRSVSEEVFGFYGSDEEVMREYADRFGCAVVCFTYRETLGLRRGAWRSSVLAAGTFTESGRKEFEVVDRYGTGDAWFAGFLHGWDSRGDPSFALNFGNALCALAHTIEGDVANVSVQDVLAAMEDTPDLRVKR
jgi:2-dehydro-3-deoxygluconokinase